MNETRLEVFDAMPTNEAVLRNALPAIVTMLMQLVYNLADTFFIGLTRDDLQVAAISTAMPLFMVFMACGTIFGIGGASAISRACGEGRGEYAKRVSSFCVWASAAVGCVISAVFYVFMENLLSLMGVNADILDYTRRYMLIVSASGPAILLCNTFAGILRAEGQPAKAMIGMILGNMLNIVLDPIMILNFGWGISGAAIATVIGNVAGAAYYVICFLRDKSALSIHPRDFTIRDKVAVGVFSIGVPAALGPLLMSVSQIVMYSLMAAYGSLAVAAAGISGKLSMIVSTVALGIGQGIQPLMGFSSGAKNWKRYKEYMKSSLLFSLAICLIMAAVCCVFAKQIIGVFLTERESFDLGVRFAYIMQTTAFLFGVFYCFANALQAMGAAAPAFIVNVSRQGLIYLPALFVLRALFGMNGLILAQPAADILSLVLAVVLHGAVFERQTRGR
jgi:putative MATE family efflux protein